ncbi:MAG: arginase family protein [Haloarculaceae archaeon]
MFPGAAADRAEADYAVVGAPLDASTTGRPGTRYGPREVRAAAATFEDYDRHTGRFFSELSVHDHGDVAPTDDTEEYLTFLEGLSREYRNEDIVPLTVGGEHTVSVAPIRALDPAVVVCLDAHLDLRESYAGNPLSHATAMRHALRVADEVVVVGARAGSETEWERAGQEDVTVVPPDEAGSWDPSLPERVYLSVDIDAADPGFAPGTGTPEPFGLSPATMRDVVKRIAPRAAGFDVVEVNDRDVGQAATLAAKLLRTFVYAHADK